MSKLIKCKSCGAEIAKNAKSCPQCGAKNKKPIFKRWWFWAVIVIIAVTAFSGGEADDPAGAGSQGSGLSSSESNDKVTIEETVLYENGGIRVTAKGIEDTITGVDINLLVENDTANNIAVGCTDFVVNGVTVDGYMYIDVAAGKKSNGTLSLYNTSLKTAGIEDIATLKTFDAYISDTDTYMKTADIYFEICTSIADTHTQTVDDTGDILFDQNGITVISKSLTKDYIGGTVTVLVKNSTGEDLIVQADNVSVNGYTISVLHSDAVCDGTVRFCEIELLETYLNENEIEEIDEATFELVFLNPKTYETVAKTGELQIGPVN